MILDILTGATGVPQPGDSNFVGPLQPAEAPTEELGSSNLNMFQRLQGLLGRGSSPTSAGDRQNTGRAAQLLRAIANFVGQQNPLGQMLTMLANLLEGQGGVTPSAGETDDTETGAQIPPTRRTPASEEGQNNGGRLAQLLRAIAGFIGRQNPLGQLFTALASFLDGGQVQANNSPTALTGGSSSASGIGSAIELTPMQMRT